MDECAGVGGREGVMGQKGGREGMGSREREGVNGVSETI